MRTESTSITFNRYDSLISCEWKVIRTLFTQPAQLIANADQLPVAVTLVHLILIQSLFLIVNIWIQEDVVDRTISWMLDMLVFTTYTPTIEHNLSFRIFYISGVTALQLGLLPLLTITATTLFAILDGLSPRRSLISAILLSSLIPHIYILPYPVLWMMSYLLITLPLVRHFQTNGRALFKTGFILQMGMMLMLTGLFLWALFQ